LEFVITARDLVKKYKGTRAVGGINFAGRPRECFGLPGPNGAGKSSVATANLLVVAAMGLVNSPWALLVPPVLGLAGLLFAALSMIWTGLAPNIDSFNYFFALVITPLFLFSGVFFPLTSMPGAVQQVAWFSPLYHLVNLTRGLTIGDAGFHLVGEVVWLLAAALLTIPVSLHLLRRLVIK